MATLTGLVALLLVGGLVVVLVTVARSRPSAADLAWLTGNPDPPHDEAEVVSRYLRRHRTDRVVGALTGVCLAVVVGIRWYGTLVVGVGGRSPLADPLFLGLTGVVVGALAAESFRLPRPQGPVRASLVPRADGAGAGHVRAARVTAAVATLLTSADLVHAALARDDVAAATGTAVTLLLGLAVVALAELTRARVVGRRRPVLSARATRLDERLRAFATGSVAHLELAAAVLTAAWVVSATSLLPDDADWLGVVAVVTGLVVAVVQLRAARPRPPRAPRLSGSVVAA
ncbi:hypothetical protein GXP71_13795 [Cellulomonas sp. H30R-01]|uniref:hypothetical protein n=1 Tax=Cellulomonas sp. H30R-01 TaxID=2704467 RepID=UPI00138BB1C0|nr:hypothetical protein [Cellulomonas sp. H30R-01]QHT57046.1 hypothetical protein GXP71_13795 [Cellulomonas sp. H30R-01]